MRWLVENVGLILLALTISVVVWSVAQWEQDPITEAEFPQAIPVEIENQPPGTYLAAVAEEQVRVYLKAPDSVWEQLNASNLRAVLDLSLDNVRPGTLDVPVRVEVQDVKSVRVLRWEPEFIRIELEEVRERPVPVRVRVLGEPDLGYEADEVTVVSDTVRVKGPSTQVDRVVEAVAEVSLLGARDTLEQAAVLTPVDAEGQRVEGVTLEPEQIGVTVTVSQMPNVKEMSVTVDTLGLPAGGYRVARVVITPPVVRVRGPVLILDDLPGFLTTVPISIEGRTESVVERLPLELPTGISMFDPSEPWVQVRVEIEPLQGSKTVTRTLTFQGLDPGLIAIASPEAVEVILSGPQPRLDNLLPEDVRVVLLVADLLPGDVFQLQPVVIQPEGITVDSVIPETVQVQIVQGSTPTPTLTLIPTLTLSPTSTLTATPTLTATLTPEP